MGSGAAAAPRNEALGASDAVMTDAVPRLPRPPPHGAPSAAPERRTQRAPRCQVPDCATPELSRAYNQRTRLCSSHMRDPVLHLYGTRLRFCQKCNRLQPVEEFQGDKRTCVARLEAHNTRRRELKQRHEAERRSAAAARGEQALAHATTSAGPGGPASGSGSPAPSVSPSLGADAGTDSDGGGVRALMGWGATSSPETELAHLEHALYDNLFDFGDFLCDELDAHGAPVPPPPQQQPGAAAQRADVLHDSMAAVEAARAAAAAAAAAAQTAQAPQRGALPSPVGSGSEGDVSGEADAAAAAAAAADAELSPAAAAAAARAFQAGYALAAAAAAAAAATGLHSHTLHVKLLEHAAEAAVPLPLPACFKHLYTRGNSGGIEPAAFGASIRPGCILITVQSLLRAPPAAPLTDAADAAAALLAPPPGAGAGAAAAASFLRAQAGGGVLVRTCGTEVTLPLTSGRPAAADAAEDAPPPPLLSPLAVVVGTGASETTLRYEGATPRGATHGCRLFATGRVLPLRVAEAGADVAVTRVTLAEALGEEGCALFEVLPPEFGGGGATGAPQALHRAGRARPVLLTADAALAAEVASAGEASAAACAAAARLRQPAAAAGFAAAREQLEHSVLVLGAALRPEASPEVVAAAAAAALWLGWPTALSRLLRAPQLAYGPDAHARFLALLCHAAAAAPRRDVLRVLATSAPPLARGAALAATLLAAAREDGNTHGAHALHAAVDALTLRRFNQAASDAADADAPAALELLFAAAAALDASEAAADGAASAAEAASVVAAASLAVEQSPHASPAAVDFRTFSAQQAADVRPTLLYLLLVLSVDVMGSLRRISLNRVGPLPVADLKQIELVTQEQLFRALFLDCSWTCLPLTLLLLGLVAAPWARVRALYARVRVPLLVAHWAAHFLLNHVIFEQYMRVTLAIPPGMARLPRWWTLAQVNITVAALQVPLHAAVVVALLAVRTAMPLLPRRWALWPMGEPLDGGGAVTHARVQLVLCAAAAAVLLVAERRAFRAWRAAAELRAKKQQ